MSLSEAPDPDPAQTRPWRVFSMTSSSSSLDITRSADAKRPLMMSGLFQFGGPGVSDLSFQAFDFIVLVFLV
ncbi:hypothetical protein AERO8C_90059 [Aeromonas veronii]|uniref:Uncharacterized protein n=1 Tax=Aeromonas veronii TaxID=654 RepID=A0A653LE10_AERVE|nr:hypothetical protein AERO8C_90059 [Aeromonas veronii]